MSVEYKLPFQILMKIQRVESGKAPQVGLGGRTLGTAHLLESDQTVAPELIEADELLMILNAMKFEIYKETGLPPQKINDLVDQALQNLKKDATFLQRAMESAKESGLRLPGLMSEIKFPR